MRSTSVTVGTSPVQIFQSSLGTSTVPHSVVIQSVAANTGIVYVGGDNTVTTANGLQLEAGRSLSIDVVGVDQLWAVASAAGQDVRVFRTGHL